MNADAYILQCRLETTMSGMTYELRDIGICMLMTGIGEKIPHIWISPYEDRLSNTE